MWTAAATCSRQYRLLALAVGLLIATTLLPARAEAKGKDTIAPTMPANVAVMDATATTISLAWQPSTDNKAVMGYDDYRNGVRVGKTTTTSYRFSSLACGTTYTLGVAAYDGAGNRSQTATAIASTTECPDVAPPTAPTGAIQAGATQTSVSLLWSASLDDVGVSGYDVYLGADKVGSTTFTNSTVGGLA